MSTMREESRKEFTGDNTFEGIQAGSLQRIADAVEKMVGDWDRLQRRAKWAEEALERANVRADHAEHQARALRGVITKLKRKSNPPPTDSHGEGR